MNFIFIEILSTKDHHENVRRLVLVGNDTFPIQYANFDTEVQAQVVVVVVEVIT